MQPRGFPMQSQNRLAPLRVSGAWCDLVTASQVPHEWQMAESLEYRAVTLAHLPGREDPAQRVVDMRISPRLIKNQVAIHATVDGLIQPLFKSAIAGTFSIMKMRAQGVVLDPVNVQLPDDVIGSVAVVRIAVENANTIDQAGLLERQGCDHEAVESAIRHGIYILGVMKP